MSIIDSNNAGINSVIEEWFDKYVTTSVKPIIVKKENGTFSHIDIKGNIIIDNYPGAQFPFYIVFNQVEGNFTLSNCHQLNDRRGFPIHITGDFICEGCEHLNENIIRLCRERACKEYENG